MLIRGFARAVGHGKDYACANGSRELNDLVDFFLSRTHPLRTCEVGDCSRFAVERKHQREMDQLLRLCVQRSVSMNLFEVRREMLVGSEIRCAFGQIWHIPQPTTRPLP